MQDGSSSQNSSYIVEAEDMRLTGYQIENRNSKTFVKLVASTGTAEFNFSLPTGKYDIDISYLSESVGQNTYTLYIANNQIVAWLGKDRDDQWHLLSEQQWHAPRNIQINDGDEIRIEALGENGSYVTFDFIEFKPSIHSISKAVSKTDNQNFKQAPETLVTKDESYITLYPEEYEHAIKNPLKGFRAKKPDHEYSTLIKTYFKWSDLENSASDGMNKIKEACDERWHGYARNNVKAIPRVYLDWPGQDDGWPDDMEPGNYSSDRFKERVIALIKKLGRAWDNDPRVAYVEMGLIGEWGEMEFPDTRDDIKEAMAAQFNASFQNKLVMIRWPNTYSDHIYNFGYYWDSFAHHNQEYYTFHVNKTSPKWKIAVIGGEVAYNWGSLDIQPGESPDISLKDPLHRNYIIYRIRKLHANHLGWISLYDQHDKGVSAGAEIMQKALGYRFVITEINYPERIDEDNPFTFSFKVKNTGSSPFYYNWPVEVSLLDPVSKKPVWKRHCTDLDITTWFPGDEWNDSLRTYTEPARTYTVSQKMPLPDVSPGEYILAIAILDPAGNQPSARFAIENYYNGGRHPLGKIGVFQSIDSFTLSNFDDMQEDKSLFYQIHQ